MGTKSFVQIKINAVFTTTSGKMQFRSGVFDHFNLIQGQRGIICVYIILSPLSLSLLRMRVFVCVHNI
jgi:hypothetical protein